MVEARTMQALAIGKALRLYLIDQRGRAPLRWRCLCRPDPARRPAGSGRAIAPCTWHGLVLRDLPSRRKKDTAVRSLTRRQGGPVAVLWRAECNPARPVGPDPACGDKCPSMAACNSGGPTRFKCVVPTHRDFMPCNCEYLACAMSIASVPWRVRAGTGFSSSMSHAMFEMVRLRVHPAAGL